MTVHGEYTGVVRDHPALGGMPAAPVANVAAANADGTYGTEEAALINELKTKVNALLASLRAAGVLSE
ncbi:hypothetical protein [Micromonospora sp. NPDC003816]|uniref:hypothetical protein n=1 Tax=Micromonospora sp. NPDC003816 TaxID=3364224 RepID=UPI0036B37237